jgi:hypothetical protein
VYESPNDGEPYPKRLASHEDKINIGKDEIFHTLESGPKQVIVNVDDLPDIWGVLKRQYGHVSYAVKYDIYSRLSQLGYNIAGSPAKYRESFRQ